MLSSSWSGYEEFEPRERSSFTQTSLIRELDGYADRLATILNSQDGDPLGCLKMEDDSVANHVHSSDLFETLGNYFEMKGRNFGAATAARSVDYDDSNSGPVQRAEDRIKALRYAITMYEQASKSLRQSTKKGKRVRVRQIPALL